MHRIHITEVAPRDGFQILPIYIPYETKVELLKNLMDAGCQEIEASSFVSPKWVPQMVDSAQICQQFKDITSCTMTYLVPNLKGAQRAIEAGCRQLFVTTSASAKHARENLNQTIAEVLQGAKQIARLAEEHHIVHTATIASAFGYALDSEGVSSQRVCEMACVLRDAGFSAITLCDTSGEANPSLVKERCELVQRAVDIPIGIHLHQAGGVEFANALAALESGIRIFESAAGGLGGCPYVPKAKGNIATELLVGMFHAMGYETGIDLAKIQTCGKQARALQLKYGSPICQRNEG